VNDDTLQLKRLILTSLMLEDLTPEEIDDDAPLFQEGLGLDSIDALELVVAIEREYGIRFDVAGDLQAALGSVSSLARYIAEHRTTGRDASATQDR